MIVPKKYFDLFPLDSIKLPPHIANDLDDLPPAGKKWAHNESWVSVMDAGGESAWKQVVQGYLASVAYIDAQIGMVLDALEKSPHRDNTIVVLFGDHGWHLGEKERFEKGALWEEATRAPLIWVAPGVTKPGSRCDATVEFLSIYPTLCDLARLTKAGFLGRREHPAAARESAGRMDTSRALHIRLQQSLGAVAAVSLHSLRQRRRGAL